MIDPSIKLIAIVGPTASGKTDLALALAEQFNGEIVCVDSRTIYRGMDIGTAKPTARERAHVRHHLLDLVNPGETLNAATFKELAEAAVTDIVGRGKTPFLVGGSGLYMDAVLFDYEFPPEADSERRVKLEGMTNEELVELLAAEDPEAAEWVDLANRRRVIRAIETAGMRPGRSVTARLRTLVLGLGLNKKVIQKRIEQRAKEMLAKGLINEVWELGEKYGWDSEVMTTTMGYSDFRGVILDAKTEEEAMTEMVRGHLMLMRKQLTWFKRNPAIQWLDEPGEAELLVRDFLGQV